MRPMSVFLVEDKRIAVIGAGSIGAEIIDTLYNNGHRRITATRRNQEALKELEEKYEGIKTTINNIEAVEESDIVILCTKPRYIKEITKKIGTYASNKLVISIAAGVRIDELEGLLENVRVARVMTGIHVKKEVAAYTVGTKCNQEDKKTIKYIFGQNALEEPEEQLDTRTYIACRTGITAIEIETEIQELVKHGMKEQHARIYFAGKLRAIASGLDNGMTGEQIYMTVAGPDSFTERLYLQLKNNGYFSMLTNCITRTLNALKK